MPNIKIFVDETHMVRLRDGLESLLPGLRARLCEMFSVNPAISQVAILPVLGLPDQAVINVELHILSRPGRTRPALLAVAEEIRTIIGTATGQHVAVRIATFEAGGYVTLK